MITVEIAFCVARWRRLGSEAESADRSAGLTGPISDDDLRSALAGHLDADLAGLPEGEREAALDELLRGYREGA